LKSDRHAAAASVLKEIQQRWGEGAVHKAPKPHKAQSFVTTYPALDAVIPGIPRGQIFEFIGSPSCGMTTLAMRLIAAVQAKNEPVIYVDFRYSFDPYYAESCGVSVKDLFVVRPAFVMSGLDIAYQVIAENAAGLVVFNSTTEILSAPGGSQALDSTFRKLTPVLRRSACAVVFLTALPAKSAALAHYATLQLGFVRQGWIERPEDVLGFETQITVLRNKQGPVGQSATIQIRLDGNEAGHEEAA
jgi:RecA/RadA recombinase